ncbi:hypothetical protein BKA61DRAFT_166849 [Leptodontidium sp. MPI-SDFR-AT-0119]|nr:hypothetical protein BKA61DRAFT_166849 [Leptodontidium sp. MPI-SDFR-AT-0119]
MDPLSLTASLIAVVGLASQTSKALRSLYNLRHAPREILELANEVSELQALLSLVQKATDNIAQDTLSPGDLDFIEGLIKVPENRWRSLMG